MGDRHLNFHDERDNLAIQESPAEHRRQLQRLHHWAVKLETDGLAVLYTSQGKGRWVLNPRLPGQERGLVTIWNENRASMSPTAPCWLTRRPTPSQPSTSTFPARSSRRTSGVSLADALGPLDISGRALKS